MRHENKNLLLLSKTLFSFATRELLMKIKFLGTSAAWPLPRLGCQCNICSSKDPKDRRTRTQLLINDVLLLDAGIDTYQHLINSEVDPKKIKFVAVSHEHPDHTLGFQDLSRIYLPKKKGQIGSKSKIEVIIHQKTFSKIKNLFHFNEYKVLPVEIGQIVKVGGLDIQLLPVNHTDSSFGILVKEDNKKFFYAPDVKSLPKETFEKIKGVDIIAFDGSQLEIKLNNHQTILEGIELGKILLAKRIYFLHIGHLTMPHKELESFVKDKGGKQFNISYNGLIIDL